MADTFTTNLAMRKADPADVLDVSAHINAAYDIADAFVGAVKCTSTTRPTTTYGGQLIYETDTGRLAENTGTKASPAWTYVSSVILVCTSTTRPTVGLIAGLTIYESNTGFVRTYTGTAWNDAAMPNCTSSARPANPITGDLAYETDTNAIIIYSGSAWVYRSLITCTSSTHPTGAIAAGTLIYETDTGNTLNYSGSAFETLVHTGAWISSFTPVWSQTGGSPALGAGTVVSRYTKIGRTVHAQYRYAFGTGGSFGTGTNAYMFTVPVTPVNPGGLQAVGTWSALIGSTFYAGVAYMNTAGQIGMFVNATSSSVNPASPATFTTTSTLSIDFTYETTA